ncbi:hypothetical protein [Chitinilyticum piscinae]|uniref:Uncharacterized protein n=1 Tax=Chitinilyticum piscinae TaxID=2866724 RepID=A0A8J7FNN1_9NEIS|nr:hypothetical protein [Chitinilyticum piscinae]MBE9610740.1 hypothetical protein [Chitinilyticum piscinae]
MQRSTPEFRFPDDDPAADWPPLSGAVLGIVLAMTGWVLWQALTGDQWVPVLDGANLLFHEAGHPLFGIVSERLTVYGGTLAQLAFPLVVLAYFHRRADTLGTAVSGLWLLENGLNIGRYLGDARAQALPLVGNGEHDWTEILSRWGMLYLDTTLAALLRGVCVLGMLTILLLLCWQWWDKRQQEY